MIKVIFQGKKIQKIIVALAISLLCFGLAFLLHSSEMLDVLNQKLTHSLYGEGEISEDVLIVAIDEKTLAAPEDGGLGAVSKWPREFFATSLETIREGGSEAIFLDVIFGNETSHVSFLEIANLILEDSSASALGGTVAGYLEGDHPQDLLLAESLGEDVYMLKYSETDGVLKGNILTTSGETTSLDIFTGRAETGFADVAVIGNEQNVYSLPIGYAVNGSFEESLSLKIVRDYLNADGGVFEDDQKLYSFDAERTIPVEDGQFYVNYSMAPYELNSVSLTDVYRGNIAAKLFDGKIVLIGATAAVLQDRHFTPISDSIAMPGVEIQANAIQTILDGEFLSKESDCAFSLFLGALLLISVFAFLYLPVLAGVGVLIAEIASFPFYAQWRFDNGVIIDLIWPIFGIFVAYLAVLAYRNLTEFKARRKLKEAFSHYVSPELVNEISAKGGEVKLGGERRNITTFFLDIESFTSISEKLEPQEVVTLMNTYFDTFTQIIMSHGGMVDKFEGDAIMALFGAPLASEDHGHKACLVALAIRDKIGELNAKTGYSLNIRVGIATGEAIVGNMGSKTRFDYTAMGDTVNVAARLESGNKFYGTRILVNSGTMQAVQEVMSLRRIDRVRLKGKGEAVDIFEVLGKSEEMTEDGRAFLEEWHQLLEYYRNQKWDEVEGRLKLILKKLPDDGPAKAYLARVASLRLNPPEAWDGTWGFDEK